jgi:predicted hydrocarbon binding protein
VNVRLLAARLYLPAGLRKRKLAELLDLTAAAFGATPPAAAGLSLADLRRLYAERSRSWAERALSRPEDSEAAGRLLFEGGERLGREVRTTLRVATRREVMAAARVLYGGLDIDLEGDAEGDIVVRRCSFEGLYPAEVCRLMSRLDAGLLSGLAGGGDLAFTERLTEGAGRCRARFTFPGAR